MHHAEGAEEQPDPETLAAAEQGGQHNEIDQRIAGKESDILEFGHQTPQAPERCPRHLVAPDAVFKTGAVKISALKR
jgi:hypothetical protein